MVDGAALGGSTILLIEDDDLTRDCVAELFLEEGFGVVHAPDGRAGLQSLREMQRPCLIVLDLIMPVMNGFEFLRRLRGDPDFKRWARLPVVTLTASWLDPPREVTAALKKPFDISELLRVVRESCG